MDIKERINELKARKNAVILAHYYTPFEVQAVADYVGDSFYLARIAKSSSADIIVFCGVNFMGESAKILNPDKKVLMPDVTADCPMAHMADLKKIKEMREKYPDLAVVCYINSTAELKCHSDVCVTSSNAVKIVKSLPNKNIFFIPDKNLGRFVAEQVPEKNVLLNDGFCPVHAAVSKNEVLDAKKKYPDAKVLSHPECEKEILDISDFIGSTSDIISFASNSEAERFIICTEDGIEFELGTSMKDKSFLFPATRPCCKDMKLNTLEKLLYVLETEENEITVDDEIRERALLPLEKMLELGRSK